MKTKLIAVPIPAKYKWRAIDESGEEYVYDRKPVPATEGWDEGCWVNGNGDCMQVGLVSAPKDWRNTLERIVEIEWV